jgi:hypothetical protein
MKRLCLVLLFLAVFLGASAQRLFACVDEFDSTLGGDGCETSSCKTSCYVARDPGNAPLLAMSEHDLIFFSEPSRNVSLVTFIAQTSVENDNYPLIFFLQKWRERFSMKSSDPLLS